MSAKFGIVKQKWKKGMNLTFSAALLFGSIVGVVPQKAAAAPTVMTGPGGVADGLISWVNLSVADSVYSTATVPIAPTVAGAIHHVNDLTGGRNWQNASTAQYKPDAINYNPGLTKGSTNGFLSLNKFNVDDLSREVFSVQSNATNNAGFPWELGGDFPDSIPGEKAKYTRDTISSYFGTDVATRQSRSLDTDQQNSTNTHVMHVSNLFNSSENKHEWALSLDGKSIGEPAVITPYTPSKFNSQEGITTTYYFGAGHSSVLNGATSELIVYNRPLEPEERKQVNSYLGIKYGLTIKNPDSTGIEEYIDSNKGVFWNPGNSTDATYRITGLGRDDASALKQKQSVSQEDNALVTIALGDKIDASNAAITGFDINNDRSFFMFGDNNKSTDFTEDVTDSDAPTGLTSMARQFTVQKTNNWADAGITLSLDQSVMQSGYNYYLLINGKFDKSLRLTDGKVQLNTNKFGNVATFTFVAEDPFFATLTITEPSGNTITIPKPEIKGTSEPGSTVTAVVFDHAGHIVATPTVTVNGDGTWSFAPETELPDGDYRFEVTAVKNGKTAKKTKALTVDTTEIALVITKPSGSTVTESKPEFTGTSDPGSTVAAVVYDHAGHIVATPTVTVNGDGTWSFAPETELPDGDYTFEVTAVKDGKTAKKTKALTVAVPDAALIISKPSGSTVTESKPEFTGTTEPGSTVTAVVYDHAGHIVATPIVTVNGDGTWSFTPSVDLAPGEYKVEVTAMKNGKMVTKTKTFTVAVVDKTALQAKVNEIKSENLKENAYTPESWQALQDALKQAEKVLNDPNATQAEVNAALAALNDARNHLVSVNGEPGLVSLQVGDANGKPIVLTPAFDDQQLNYKAVVPNEVTTVGIDPQALQPGSKVAVTLNGNPVSASDWNNLPLKEGLNTIQVQVTGTDGKQTTYTLEIIRTTNKLVSLTPSTGGLNPAFESDKEAYSMTVSGSVYQLQWTPVALDPGAKIEIAVNGGTFSEVASGATSTALPLNIGANTVKVKVTDRDGRIKEYTITVIRASSSGSNRPSGGGGGGSTPNTGDIVTTVNDNQTSFATQTAGHDGVTTVKIDGDKLNGILSQGGAQHLAIRVPGDGDVQVQGLTAAMVKQLKDTGSSLEIGNLLAIYPVPSSQLDLSAIAKQFGDAALGDIAVNVNIRPSEQALIDNARSRAVNGGYELLVNPVSLDLIFSRAGQTIRSEQLGGYAPRYIALPEGIDPNRITTGVIVNPDGTVNHVPTVVTKISNRYFARIQDLRSHGNYSVIWNPQDFTDVKSHWAHKTVNNVAARLILAGTGNNDFSPDRNINRSEFAVMAATGMGLMGQKAAQNTFHDVTSTAWYHNGVSVASEFGIVEGYEDGTFRGDRQITREQGIAMIARAYNLVRPQDAALSQAEIASALSVYGDASNLSDWARETVARMIRAGIVEGSAGQLLKPQENMTRAEAAALIERMLKTTDLIDK